MDSVDADDAKGWREDFNARVRANLAQLDGTEAAVISMLTGFDRDELERLGGVPEE